jgi:NitT/TauT family transport system permease protein
VTGRRLRIIGCQLLFLALCILGWQFVPQIGALRDISHVFDPYFVSSPTRVAKTVGDLATGSNGSPEIWSYLGETMLTSILGTFIGIALGALSGLVLSNFAFLSAVIRPFIVAANATPRVALIPVVVIICGVSRTTSIVIAVLVVYFVAFFNAYEGGTTIPPQILQNAKLLGARNLRMLYHVRQPFVLAWTIASLPLAATFAIISVVTGEILTGFHGVGSLLATADITGNASLTFAVVFYLALVGLLVVIVAEAMRRRVLHWWGR